MRPDDAARIRQDATYPENRGTALVPADTLNAGDVLTHDRRFPAPGRIGDRKVLKVDRHVKQPAIRRDGTPGVGIHLEGRATAMIVRADHLVRVLVPEANLTARQEAQERC